MIQADLKLLSIGLIVCADKPMMRKQGLIGYTSQGKLLDIDVHFIGYHLNIEMVSDEMNINIKEFTLAGIPYQTLFAHHWFIGTDDKANAEEFQVRLDQVLKSLNDDYRVERSAALKKVVVDVIPSKWFYSWMKMQGKEGGQNKFPRVLKANQYANWKRFVKANGSLTS